MATLPKAVMFGSCCLLIHDHVSLATSTHGPKTFSATSTPRVFIADSNSHFFPPS